jgi:hypothetical protein
MLTAIMSDPRLGPSAEGLAPRVPGVDHVIDAGDTCQGAVESVKALRAGYPAEAPDSRSPTTETNMP